MFPKKTSAAWQHFVEVDSGKNAKCNHCGKTVVITNGSTGNMFRHIKLRHPHLTVEKRSRRCMIANEMTDTVPVESIPYTSSNNEAVTTTVMEVPHMNAADITKLSSSSETVAVINSTVLPNLPTVSGDVAVINSTVLPKFPSASINLSQEPVSYYLIQSFDEYKRQALDKQLLRIIVKNLISFNIVESQEFIRLVNMLNPTYVLPSRKTLSNDVLISMYESTADEIKSTLKNVNALALTTDCWTSVNDEHFIAFTVHYLNKDLELKSNFLQCFSSLQKFNEIDIGLFIDELASNWYLHDKIMAVITAGSEEVKKAVLNCNMNHIPCFAQILNQIVMAGLVKINSLTLKVRNVVQYFNRSSMALSKFHEIQKEMGLPDLKLVIDTPSRWDTTFNMFTIFLKNKVPLLSSIGQLQLNFFKLSLADFHYLENAVKLLVIFNSIKKAMCSENYLSLSKVLHMIHYISKHLQNVLEDTKLPSDIINMGYAMKEGLKQFEKLEMNEFVSQAVLLDPRFKKRGFPNGFFKEACIALSHNVVTEREDFSTPKNEQPVSSEPEQNKTETESESEYLIDMWSEFDSKEPTPVQSHTTTASIEVDAYLNDLYLPIEENPLTYWANVSNQNKYPALFILAKRMLCVPATSVPCQQLYSDDGYIFCKKRKYLPSLRADKILFLYHNL